MINLLEHIFYQKEKVDLILNDKIKFFNTCPFVSGHSKKFSMVHANVNVISSPHFVLHKELIGSGVLFALIMKPSLSDFFPVVKYFY